MDTRLTALETKWETVIPTLATKFDVEGLRTEMHKGFADMIKWIVGTAIVLAVASVTVMTFVLNNATPKAAPPAPVTAVQPPIIIQVPAYPAAQPQAPAPVEKPTKP